jgi:hypothetical protein
LGHPERREGSAVEVEISKTDGRFLVAALLGMTKGRLLSGPSNL